MEATATLAVVIFRDENFSELRHKAACIQLGFGMVFRNGTTSIWSHLPLKVGRRSGVVTRVLRSESANVSQERLCSLRRRFYNNNNNNNDKNAKAIANDNNSGVNETNRTLIVGPSFCGKTHLLLNKLRLIRLEDPEKQIRIITRSPEQYEDAGLRAELCIDNGGVSVEKMWGIWKSIGGVV